MANGKNREVHCLAVPLDLPEINHPGYIGAPDQIRLIRLTVRWCFYLIQQCIDFDFHQHLRIDQALHFHHRRRWMIFPSASVAVVPETNTC